MYSLGRVSSSGHCLVFGSLRIMFFFRRNFFRDSGCFALQSRRRQEDKAEAVPTSSIAMPWQQQHAEEGGHTRWVHVSVLVASRKICLVLFSYNEKVQEGGDHPTPPPARRSSRGTVGGRGVPRSRIVAARRAQACATQFAEVAGIRFSSL